MNPEKFRQDFLQQLDAVQPLQQLFDLLPDVTFFMKDRQGRFVMRNRHGCEYCRVGSERELIGKTDYDFHPKARADLYVKGDQKVMRTGVPVINAIEPAPEEDGSDRLIICSKVPVRNRQGRIIGIAGIHREVEGFRATPKSYGRLSEAVQYLHTHYAKPLTTRQLASMVGVSSSQFARRFHKLFNATLRQYLLRIRIRAAGRLLTQSDKSITEIAVEIGFYDHAHFSRTFSRLMGIAPLAYRKQHQSD
jgi:AraC-like DNA-binding protein